MKRNKILSLLLSVSMLTALTACGSQGSDTPAASTTDNGSTTAATESTASSDDGYVLDKVTLVVDGTFNAICGCLSGQIRRTMGHSCQ